jgi:tryptophanyl-tRNA synthetase
MMPKQEGARKVSKREMVEYMQWLRRGGGETSSCPIKGECRSHGDQSCEDCDNEITSAIIRVIKAHREA